MKYVLYLLLLVAFVSCEKDEPEFSCNTNTVSEVNGTKECGTSKIMAYSGGTDHEEFRIQVAGGFTIRLINQNGLFEEGKTYTPYELYKTELNKHLKNTVTIIKIDRTNKKFTADFHFRNELAYNYQAYNQEIKGTMKELAY